jgi:GTP cyclohydrolase I
MCISSCLDAKYRELIDQIHAGLNPQLCSWRHWSLPSPIFDLRFAGMRLPNVETIAQHYAGILRELGVDLQAEGTKETPMRAAKALLEMTEGSRTETDQLTKMFKAECQTAICHDMVIVEGIKEVGLCEHHLLPILMDITIAYILDKKILGLSKLSRIAGYFARRLQNQERTAHLIAVFIEQIVEPLGVAVLINGKHMCAMARGVRDSHSVMKVNVMHGAFQKDQSLRSELLSRLSTP